MANKTAIKAIIILESSEEFDWVGLDKEIVKLFKEKGFENIFIGLDYGSINMTASIKLNK